MKLRDLELTRIGLGTNRLTNTPESQAFVRAAVEAGVNFRENLGALEIELSDEEYEALAR